MTAPREDAGARWFRRFARTRDAPVRLVCFPHAGGGAGFFRTWPAFLSEDVELVAVQYPGRHDRFTEPMIDDMDPLAEAITAAVESAVEKPTVFFGHSLGATVAFEVATRLSTRRRPAWLVASGRAAPGRLRPNDVHLRDDLGVETYLRELGGTDTRVLDDPELRELAIPVVRNDLRVAGTYRYRDGPPLSCPITAVTGRDDHTFPVTDALAWAGHTTGPFEHHALPGGHFYLEGAPRDLVELLIGALAKAR